MAKKRTKKSKPVRRRKKSMSMRKKGILDFITQKKVIIPLLAILAAIFSLSTGVISFSAVDGRFILPEGFGIDFDFGLFSGVPTIGTVGLIAILLVIGVLIIVMVITKMRKGKAVTRSYGRGSAAEREMAWGALLGKEESTGASRTYEPP